MNVQCTTAVMVMMCDIEHQRQNDMISAAAAGRRMAMVTTTIVDQYLDGDNDEWKR
jgi:hypothetical protein